MSDIAIQVDAVSKLYHIGEKQRYKTARETVMTALNAPARIVGKWMGRYAASNPSTELWALKDISFNVARGEVVGIVGRNGAGKSTLLKVLSRITEPTSGRIAIKGRVGSLLEVGTGFHPELTGRENIFLNGAILGMRRAEITAKFDEIVAFSEIDKFLDTPVKFYSSGMYMRLAFAVAAHLEPEILVVDEVLAVGDAQFQKKCLGKMKDVAGQGRTVLFVSHNMGAVASLCTKCVMLSQGKLKLAGPTDEVLAVYRAAGADIPVGQEWRRPSPGNPSLPHFTRIYLNSENGPATTDFLMGDSFSVQMELAPLATPKRCALSVAISTVTGIPVLHCVGNDSNFYMNDFSTSKTVSATLPQMRLYPGEYVVTCWIGDPMGHDFDHVQHCLRFVVNPGPLVPRAGLSHKHALIHLDTDWSVTTTHVPGNSPLPLLPSN